MGLVEVQVSMPPYSSVGTAPAGRPVVPMTSLSQQAYDSLCYDFPVVDTQALAALASAYSTSVSRIGRFQFPITLRFVSGLRYLVESHFEKKICAEAPANDDLRSAHLVSICGYVFLKVPAQRLIAAMQDNGNSLNQLLSSFTDIQEAEMEECLCSIDDVCREPVLEGVVDTHGVDVTKDQMADELDDDDTKWEPIETQISVTMPVARIASTIVQESCVPEWPELMAKVTTLGTMMPFEVTSNEAVWDDLQLTEDLIQALKVLRSVNKAKHVDVMPLARLYTGLMCDRVTANSNSSTRSQEIGRLVTTMLAMTDSEGTITSKSEIMTWEGLALRVLGTLSYKVRGPGNQERALWQALSSSLQFLERQLCRLSAGPSMAVLIEEMEMVFQSLCFWLKHAPGNALIGSSLMQTGILRTALQAFLKAGSEPQLEALREFLLLAMARSTEVAQYLVEVPAFEDAISNSAFLKEDTLTWPHALVWPLLLKAGQQQKKLAIPVHLRLAEDRLHNELRQISIQADDQTLPSNPLLLTRLLQVLQQLLVGCSASSNRLWQTGSSLDKGLTECYMTLRALLISLRVESEQVEDKENNNESERRAKKSMELLSRLLPMLKRLTIINKGSGSSKAD